MMKCLSDAMEQKTYPCEDQCPVNRAGAICGQQEHIQHIEQTRHKFG
jgi:hypothetical protein